MRQSTFKTVSVFSFAHSGFERTETAEFAFDANPDRVSDIDDFAGNIDVILKTCRSLGIGFE